MKSEIAQILKNRIHDFSSQSITWGLACMKMTGAVCKQS